jgi:negative regulator of flagellin synthesis FlgM
VNINRPSGSSFINPYQKSANSQKQIKQQSAQANDKVEISSTAKEMYAKKAENTGARQEKLDALKAQIQNGEYKVDSQKTAEKFYDFWLGKK